MAKTRLMVSGISTRIRNFLSTRFGILYYPLESVNFLGKSLQVVRGTIRRHPDYDDAWLLALAYHSKVVFDIGCNIGQTAFILLYPEMIERIVMVDANPEALTIAAKNLILNHLSHKAIFVCAFVTEHVGEIIEFFTVGSGAAGSIYRSHAKTASAICSFLRVPTLSVDWLCSWFNLVPDLVKIDVEGAEVKVLQGAKELAKKQTTKFFVEMHSNPELRMLDNAREILHWCKNLNYTAWYLKEKVRLEDPEQIEGRGRCHLLLLPNDEKFPDYLYPIPQGCSLTDALKILHKYHIVSNSA